MEVSLAQRPVPQYQSEAVMSTAIATVAAAPATQIAMTTETIPRTAQVDRSQLLSVDLPEKPTPTIEQTLKPYGVIMLPYREEDEATTRKF